MRPDHDAMILLGSLGAGILSSGGQLVTSRGLVTVYRVEGAANTRILIGEAGQVAILGDDTMLFLNFGSRERAEQFLATRLSQGMEGASVKSFSVPRSFLDQLRSSAVPESMAKQFPGRPILVDITKAPNQIGLRPEQIQMLKKAIIQGSGKVKCPN